MIDYWHYPIYLEFNKHETGQRNKKIVRIGTNNCGSKIVYGFIEKYFKLYAQNIFNFC